MEVMARYRAHSDAFERQVVSAHLAGEPLRGLALRHDLSHNLIRVRISEHESGGLDEDVQAAELLQACEIRIAMLERSVGRQARRSSS